MVADPAVGQPAGSRIGSAFGPYRLMRLLGSGGFGEVYEADDTAMHRVVALKLLGSTFSQNPVFRERLFPEARTAGRLREPHVVPIHACGEIDGQVYIDMRLVRGVVVGILHRRPATQHAATATPRPSSTGPHHTAVPRIGGRPRRGGGQCRQCLRRRTGAGQIAESLLRAA